MGSILSAQCTKCEFKRKVYFGGGYLDFETLCKVPAINKKTGKFSVRNILEPKNRKHYKYYHEPQLSTSQEANNDSLVWGGIFLKKTENFCPQCNLFTMTFEEIGTWN
jgi:hypothetical protein